MLKLSGLLPLAILFQEMSALKKRREKEIQGNKKWQVPGTSKEMKEKVKREVKMDKCLTEELGVQNTQLRGKKKKRENLVLLTKFQKARKVCISSKTKVE